MMLATEVHSDGTAVLRLDNEQRRNALSIAMRDAISDTLDQWATDDGVRVVVITGLEPRSARASTSRSSPNPS
jgi:enoyl-CoA hydratase